MIQYPTGQKILFAGWVAALLLSLSVSVGFAQTDITIEGHTMGPIKYKVTIASFPEGQDNQAVADGIQAELDHVNQLMSTYLPDSDVSRFNGSSETDWIDVSSETAKVIKRALDISEQTRGAFDITIGPLVDLWHFGLENKN